MAPKHFGKRKREKPPDELKENNMEDGEDDIERVANDDVTECPHCKKILPKGSLQHHLRATHSQVSGYTCSSLRQHSRLNLLVILVELTKILKIETAVLS